MKQNTNDDVAVCPKCGVQYSHNHRECPNCGHRDAPLPLYGLHGAPPPIAPESRFGRGCSLRAMLLGILGFIVVGPLLGTLLFGGGWSGQGAIFMVVVIAVGVIFCLMLLMGDILAVLRSERQIVRKSRS